MLGFAAIRVAGEAALLAQRGEVLPARDKFVDVGLVARVKDDAVAWGIKNPVDGKGQFHHAKIGAKVAARLGNVGNRKSRISWASSPSGSR